MTHQIVIRGGTVVDGTGRAPFQGDVAIDDGYISAIGQVAERGNEEIDADGLVVSPGFVDLHTHLDAQIGWDPELTPVSWHGVTTALMGNCGVTFAPCRPSDRTLLAGMMETVEDIPREAILSGLPWNWEEYGGYLDAIEQLRPAINVAGLVGHAAVRYYVMGERAVEEQATEDEIRQMCAVVDRALASGALGFSTNRYEPHKGPDGRSIPGTFADPSELVAIGRTVAARNGLMQAVGAAPEVLTTIAEEAGARLLFSWGVGPQKGAGAQSAKFLDGLCDGKDMTAITQVRGSGYMFGLQSGLPFHGETWDRVRKLDLAGRLAAIRDTATAEKLVAEGQSPSRIPLANVYYLGAGVSPDYAAPFEATVEKLMASSGESFAGLFLRLSRETDGKALFNWRMFCQNLDEVADLFKSNNIFPSLGDAGAHVSQIMDAGWATFVLSYWIRQRGFYSLEEGVRRITSGPARVLGLNDRGLLARGKRADINVFDLDEVAELQPQLVHDFPGGAARYIQRSKGYKATLVNGQVNVRNGQMTGARAGDVVRLAS